MSRSRTSLVFEKYVSMQLYIDEFERDTEKMQKVLENRMEKMHRELYKTISDEFKIGTVVKIIDVKKNEIFAATIISIDKMCPALIRCKKNDGSITNLFSVINYEDYIVTIVK